MFVNTFSSRRPEHPFRCVVHKMSTCMRICRRKLHNRAHTLAQLRAAMDECCLARYMSTTSSAECDGVPETTPMPKHLNMKAAGSNGSSFRLLSVHETTSWSPHNIIYLKRDARFLELAEVRRCSPIYAIIRNSTTGGVSATTQAPTVALKATGSKERCACIDTYGLDSIQHEGLRCTVLSLGKGPI